MLEIESKNFSFEIKKNKIDINELREILLGMKELEDELEQPTTVENIIKTWNRSDAREKEKLAKNMNTTKEKMSKRIYYYKRKYNL